MLLVPALASSSAHSEESKTVAKGYPATVDISWSGGGLRPKGLVGEAVKKILRIGIYKNAKSIAKYGALWGSV